jgi:hypothetical protein
MRSSAMPVTLQHKLGRLTDVINKQVFVPCSRYVYKIPEDIYDDSKWMIGADGAKSETRSDVTG